MTGFTNTSPVPAGVEHSVVFRRDDLYCSHPAQAGLHRFNNDELALGYWQAPCDYAGIEDKTVFCAYYYMSEPDKPYHRMVRHIAATHFRI